jgi:glycosyltransferase involved in cell wall biosynthesis
MWPVSARAAQRPDSPPLALILVRNPVSHDNRVLREVQTLRRGGFSVLVAGVVSTAEPERSVWVAGVDVIRLDPVAGLGRRRGRRHAGPPDEPSGITPAAGAPGSGSGPAASASASASTTGRGGAARTRLPLQLQLQLRRLAVTASYYAQGVVLCRRTAPALVHANDYNTMWIALAAKLLCGSRVVYDCHELWADRNGRPEWRPWLLACEALFARAADVTITASPGYAEVIARRYRVPRPAVVRNIPAAAAAAAEPGGAAAPGMPAAVYVGGLMPGRGLEPGIEALAGVPGLRMRLIGPGSPAYRAGLRRLAERCGVSDRLELLDAVAPGDVVAAITDARFGLMLIQPVCPSYELTLPNKLFEYAAAGLPMLAGDLPVIGPIVRENALGEAVAPDDRQAIAQAMGRLLDPQRNRELRARVLEFARLNTWERERETLAAAYETAMSGHAVGGHEVGATGVGATGVGGTAAGSPEAAGR